MLTTIDNPYNPYEQFTEWWLFDIEKGYNTCALLARIAHVEEDMSDVEKEAEIDRAIDQIIKEDPLNIYIRAVEPK